MADARVRAGGALDVLEQARTGRGYLLGAACSGADIRMGYTLQVPQLPGLVGDTRRALAAYFARLLTRPAFLKAL